MSGSKKAIKKTLKNTKSKFTCLGAVKGSKSFPGDNIHNYQRRKPIIFASAAMSLIMEHEDRTSSGMLNLPSSYRVESVQTLQG
mmetsp:Transcript_5348/g.6754  ORF Transcript_5348/g.6754 Transcript_5348/m.6754 type:complete len:84 (-) Transcript_5348:191-442(-)